MQKVGTYEGVWVGGANVCVSDVGDTLPNNTQTGFAQLQSDTEAFLC